MEILSLLITFSRVILCLILRRKQASRQYADKFRRTEALMWWLFSFWIWKEGSLAENILYFWTIQSKYYCTYKYPQQGRWQHMQWVCRFARKVTWGRGRDWSGSYFVHYPPRWLSIPFNFYLLYFYFWRLYFVVVTIGNVQAATDVPRGQWGSVQWWHRWK